MSPESKFVAVRPLEPALPPQRELQGIVLVLVVVLVLGLLGFCGEKGTRFTRNDFVPPLWWRGT